jgi:hypothetical protein
MTTDKALDVINGKIHSDRPVVAKHLKILKASYQN